MACFREFGEAVRAARESMGWTRVQASLKINDLCQKRESIVSPDALEKWENGRVLPKIEPVKAMAHVYGKPELIDLRVQCIEFLKRSDRRDCHDSICG
ncbi:helix-turn-helix transcriptional regulator [Sporomusa sphaeroides DSM 2875]|uniref:helix-turn-helix domain-containing protein n=1 Tax=Sporomusa sphaeroides TaxID=47679 RepID=UPI00202E181F|nr:helix-turn-helix transcriptional regulator [Sporomusa sphaeroides]MCM0760286.1 helix-turn-helix transcriptional regulator [Sporomusa sphaeroides DSM 2875]